MNRLSHSFVRSSVLGPEGPRALRRRRAIATPQAQTSTLVPSGGQLRLLLLPAAPGAPGRAVAYGHCLFGGTGKTKTATCTSGRGPRPLAQGCGAWLGSPQALVHRSLAQFIVCALVRTSHLITSLCTVSSLCPECTSPCTVPSGQWTQSQRSGVPWPKASARAASACHLSPVCIQERFPLQEEHV